MVTQAGDPPAEEEALLLLFEDRRDRSLLADWLSAEPRYRVVTPGGGLPESFDLALVDEPSLAAHGPALADRKRAADPVFLPCLLAATGESEADAAAMPDPVDDVVSLPVGKGLLRRRIENLLETRRASRRLIERERQYRELVNLAPEGILLVRDRAVAYANRAAGELFAGGDPDALVGEGVLSLVTEAGREHLAGLLADVEADGRRDEFLPLTLRGAEGGTVEAEVAGVAVTYGGEPAVQLLIRDVTRRNEREQRLDVYGRAIEAAAQGITIADASRDDLPLVYANPAFERITGYPVPAVLGRNCRFLQGENTDPATVAEIRAAIDAERAVSTEILNYRRDGEPFWNRLEIVPVTGPDGEVTHYLGLQRDVTAEKRREQRLSVLDRVLRHNVRNRMNVVKGYADELRAGGADPATAGERIAEAADDLLALSEEVRQFRNVVVDGDRDLERRDLVALLRGVIDGVTADRPDWVALEAPDSAPVEVHGTVALAFEELLSLAASGGAEPDVRLRVEDRPGGVVVELVDRGRTVPPEELRFLAEATEDPVEHPEGLEGWFVRWAVEYSDGELDADPGADPPRIAVRFPHRPADGPGDGTPDAAVPEDSGGDDAGRGGDYAADGGAGGTE